MTSTHVLGVLDLTFMDIKDENDVAKGVADRNINTNGLNSTGPIDPESPSRTSRKKEDIKALRIANNLIHDSACICTPISAAMDPSKVLWLDLSFNNLRSISETIATTFPNITTIYLQANNIVRLSEIRKLSVFTNLKSLSLFGNPVEEHKHYRNYVLFTCPKLTQFDMSPVTKSERQRTEVWSQTFRRKLNPDEDF